MKRRILSICLTLALLFSVLPQTMMISQAAVTTGSCGEDLIWTYDDTTFELTISGTGAMDDFSEYYWWRTWADIAGSVTKVTIASGVTTVGNYAFCDFTALTEVVLPEGITRIGTDAFYGCTALPAITLPESLVSIDVYAFYGCTSITSLSIPKNVATIGTNAFVEMSALTKFDVAADNANFSNDAYGVLFNKDKTTLRSCPGGFSGAYTIPSTVSRIETNAFDDCTKLSAVTIPTSVTSIGNYSFDDCDALTSVTIPDSVTEIGSHAFSGCDAMVRLILGDGVITINEYAFYNCTALMSITFGQSITTIGNDAFSLCSSLVSAKLPNSLTTMGMYAFSSCSDLTSVTLGSGLSIIPDYAFSGCSSLASITFPSNITTIGYQAFKDCDTLTRVIIPNTVTFIESYAFKDCDSLRSATIGNGITTIEEGVFYDCDNLAMVSLPSTLLSIEDAAFYWCSNLKNLTLPEGLLSIGSSAFYCTALPSITIPTTVTKISSGAFNSCYELASVHISDLTAWCMIAFEDGSANPLSNGAALYLNGEKVTTLEIPEGIDVVKDYTFYGCTSFTDVTLDEHVISVGNAAFYACSNLENLNIAEGVIGIEAYAFNGCAKLSSLTIPDSVASLGEAAFEDCTDLQSVSIGQSINVLSSNLFSRCTSLKTINLPDSIITIESYAFNECSGLECVSIGWNTVYINYNAFVDCARLEHVLYRGTEDDWSYLTIDDGNTALTASTIHYNATGDEVTWSESFGGGTLYCSVCDSALYEVIDFSLATELQDGDELLIYYPTETMVLGTTETSYTQIAIAGVNAVPENGKLRIEPGDPAILTVNYVSDTNFTLQLPDGRYLTAGSDGGSLSYTDTATECSYWYLQAKAETNLFYIYNVGANYNGSYNQTLEVYSSEFTTYGWKDAENYEFELYVRAKCTHENNVSYTDNGENHTIVCSTCDYNAVEDHNYVDGTCVCGAVEVTEPKYEPKDSLKFTMSISVGAEMTVTYNIMGADVNSYSDFYLEVKKDVAGGEPVTTIYGITADREQMTAKVNPATGEALMYQVTYKGINAKEMGDNFSTTLYAVGEDGTIYYGNTVVDSIKSFLVGKIDAETSIPELKTMAVDMLKYGAAAQVRLGYNTDNLVTADLTEEQLSYATKEISEAVNNAASSGTGAVVNTNITVTSRVQLNLSCIYTTATDPDAIKCVVTDSEGKVLSEIATTNKGGIMFSAIYENVGAKEMRDVISATFYEGETAISKTISWSVESYVAQVRAKTNVTEDELNMVNAMLTYGDSVAAYMEAK